MQSGWIFAPVGALVEKAIRSRPGSVPTSCAYGLAGDGAQYGSPTSGPAVTSRIAALSLTERETTCSTTSPPMMSPRSGPRGLRALVGLKPKIPQHEAGIRMEPPPSFACAAGTIPAATAAAEPPLEPPVVRSRFQGFRVAPNRRGSVVGTIPNS